MNFQPPDPEDDPRDDDQRMRDAELEAHRVRFEELWLKNTGFETQKDEKGYYYDDQQAAWFAYQWGIADADRAQRAESAGWQHRIYYTDNNDPGWSKWREVMECDMETLQKLAREYPARHQMRQVYTAPQQSAQPVAAANGWAKGLEIRMSQGWKLKGGICPVLYSDTVNGYGVGRDDLWLATTDALKSAQPVEVQRVGLQPAQVEAIHDALMQHTRTADIWTFASAIEAAHGIKPTSSEGGA